MFGFCVAQVLAVLRALTADPHNVVVLFSGRPKAELQEWFASVVGACNASTRAWPTAIGAFPSPDKQAVIAKLLVFFAFSDLLLAFVVPRA